MIILPYIPSVSLFRALSISFDPPLVALGGDLSRGETHLRPALDRALRRLAHPSMLAQSKVIFSAISAVKPYLGGVALALAGVTGSTGQMFSREFWRR